MRDSYRQDQLLFGVMAINQSKCAGPKTTNLMTSIYTILSYTQLFSPENNHLNINSFQEQQHKIMIL